MDIKIDAYDFFAILYGLIAFYMLFNNEIMYAIISTAMCMIVVAYKLFHDDNEEE